MTKDKEAKRRENYNRPLQFNVAQLLKQSGAASRRYKIDGVLLPQFSEEFTLAEPLFGRVKLSKTGKDVLVVGQFETVLALPCTRCLEPTNTPVSFEIEETFVPVVDIISGGRLLVDPDEDEATLITEQHIIDLSEVVRQSILLSIPSQVLCRADCRGLDPETGANLNFEEGAPKDESIDIRWAALLAIKDQFSENEN